MLHHATLSEFRPCNLQSSVWVSGSGDFPHLGPRAPEEVQSCILSLEILEETISMKEVGSYGHKCTYKATIWPFSIRVFWATSLHGFWRPIETNLENIA